MFRRRPAYAGCRDRAAPDSGWGSRPDIRRASCALAGVPNLGSEPPCDLRVLRPMLSAVKPSSDDAVESAWSSTWWADGLNLCDRQSGMDPAATGDLSRGHHVLD